jgi:acetyltransferase-like isoleucine patch superfamily enzyme
LPSISKSLPIRSKIQVYISALIKLIRGAGLTLSIRHAKLFIFVGRHVRVMNRQYLHIQRKVKFEDYCEIQGLSQEGLYFGESSTIGRGVQIRPSSYYGVGHIGYGFSIGKNSSIGPGGFIGCAGNVKIGDNVMIGPNVTIIAENHNFSDENETIKEQGVYQRGIEIKNNVWIGTNVTILDGVTVESGAVIGAGAILTKDVPANSVYIDKLSPFVRKRLSFK